MAKEPVAGRVKTRLCPPCTPAQAAAIAEASLADTLATVAATPAAWRTVALDGAPGDWLPPGFGVVAQRGGGLDERLAAAFVDAGAPAVAVAADTPQVTPALLTEALSTLARPGVDAVLGPTDDGGYWALGLRRADEKAVVGVPMSQPSTLADQRARLQARGLVFVELAALRDVDDMADAQAVAATIPHSRFAAALAAVRPAWPERNDRTALYVAVGASETTGTGSDQPERDAWPHVLARTALPPSTTLVNLGIPGATVATALREELPRALELDPTLVTVWLNVNDIVCGIAPADFERDLGTLVGALCRSGRARVLVANVPPLDRLPAYVAYAASKPEHGPEALNRVVTAYNAATARIAAREGAALVDLHTVGLAARRAGTEASFVSADGFHPSTAGHAAVAAAFADVLSYTARE